LPLWQINLEAPQYPEGLGLYIYINEINGQHPGDLNKINNLNHYIGMKRIEPDSIPELRIMPWVMRGLLVLGICVGLLGRRQLLLVWIILFLAVAAVGLYDYYLWGYDYGHNLDMDNAIIKIPGMSYQPPILGAKKLLNFTAVSLPGLAGWVAIISCAIGMLVYIVEWRRYRLLKRRAE
jgi:copper chaperone NosL